MRPDDNPLLPNYKYVPDRLSRPRLVRAAVGRWRFAARTGSASRASDNGADASAPARSLDFELELGIWIGARERARRRRSPIGETPGTHIAGFCLLNDWSARDIQGWEYQPLGPFLAKNFHTSISPWIVTPEALAPFRVAQAPRPESDPKPLPHLHGGTDQMEGALDIALEVTLSTRAMRQAGTPAHRLSLGNARHLYWTVAQMLTHHTSNGCDLRPGDLFGSGTISSPEETGWGSLLELTRAGRQPVSLPSGETRAFLEDGDEITLRARCSREGVASIGFGDCRGTIVAAPVIASE